MADEEPPPPGASREAIATEIGRLAERLDTLSSELAELRASLLREIRSRRVVVVGHDGFERIVLGADERFGHVTVVSRTATASSTGAELFANDAIDAEPANVGLALVDGGDVVSTLDVTTGGRPRLWLPDVRGEHT
jgi:hypothetical protein